ncbi:MAG: GNAT family N-acetyltransferase [Duncaniella sp.]|nr:GNAT family N-acetyltransferase [Duncaniella sp.]
MVSAFIDDTLAGYSVADCHTGNLKQIAVRREYRRRGVGSLLLRETIKGMATDFIKVLNVSSTDCPLHAFLESHNIALSGKQLEMKLKI